ncbi:uncharacterized protein PADG_12320 [Paracoccidioides brasiliensis Pb18]|uniref:Uncharacterized protein n=1 Tax=Paracoccidioides brasiliensis (strain Pb18) TaxID=502780 RepID=A0A0A0HUE3_PARBD|nr:uncharacterized protein PADG_12320 [Paracoccidioides brasiliensis Pb18]KGM91636.1 hypothetical protein PADG_12320 [Paracoccidioides brasiliensis Pb18]
MTRANRKHTSTPSPASLLSSQLATVDSHSSRRSSPRLPIAAGHVETQASMFVLASSSQITAVSTGLRLFTRARCIQCSWWDSPALQKLMISQVLGLRLVQSLKKVKSATDRSEVEAPDSRRLL